MFPQQTRKVLAAAAALPILLILTVTPVGAHHLSEVFDKTGVDRLDREYMAQLEAALAANPDDPYLARTAGLVRFFLAREGIDFDRNLAAAYEIFLSGFDRHPDNPWLLACLGLCDGVRADSSWSPITKIRFLRSALDKIDRAVEMSPDLLDVRHMRAMLFRELPGLLGRSGTMRADLEYIIAAAEAGEAMLDDRSFVQSCIALAEVCRRDEPDRAADLLHQVLLICPGLPEGEAASRLIDDWGLTRPSTARRLPDLFWNCADDRGALLVPMLQRLDGEPGNAALLADLASIHICGGLGTPEDAVEARRLITKALAIAPGDPFVRVVYGALLAFEAKFTWYAPESLTLVSLGIEEMTAAVKAVPAGNGALLAHVRRHRGMACASIPDTVFGKLTLATGDVDFALDRYRARPGLFSPQETVELLLKRGELLLRSGDVEGAWEVFGEISNVAPGSCQAALVKQLPELLPKESLSQRVAEGPVSR